ncbi:MAG: hypothetical protein LQ338_007869 [Usnochroma carphineum]|nr:MAG: hypothetical protein LQ338_007869 [Usnochroma carphineum]
MRLRRATLRDFPTTATFSVPAFINDGLYRFTNPFAPQYPDDFRKHYLRRQKQRNVLPGFVFWVAVVDPSDGAEEDRKEQEAAQLDDSQTGQAGTEKVVGYAIWRRYGCSETAKRWQAQKWAECRHVALCTPMRKVSTAIGTSFMI